MVEENKYDDIAIAPELDYQYGWRFLLSISNHDRVYLLGFDEHDFDYWKSVLGAGALTEDIAKATVFLIKELSPACLEGLVIDKVHTVCVVGSGDRAWVSHLKGRFESVRKYSLLPPNNPRVVVPLGVSSHVLQGLAIHRPGRLLARGAMFLLRSLARIGIYYPLRKRTLTIASRSDATTFQNNLQNAVVNACGYVPKDFALYLGTSDINRKTVVLPMGELTTPLIFKIASMPVARCSLTNELRAINAIAKSKLAEHVPKLHITLDTGNAFIIGQEYRPRVTISDLRFRTEVTIFLSELSSINRRVCPLSEWYAAWKVSSQTLDEDLISSISKTLLAIEKKAQAGEVIHKHLSHGDFAPWNLFWSARGLFVFDWEASREYGLAYEDAFYYAIAPELFLSKKPNPIKAKKIALRLANSIAELSGKCDVNINLQLVLWLIEQLPGYCPEFYVGALQSIDESSW